MNIKKDLMSAMPTQNQSTRLNRAIADRAGDLLPLFDFAGLLLVGYFSLSLQIDKVGLTILPITTLHNLHSLIWIAAALAPFILYDRSFTVNAYAGNSAALARTFLSRLILFYGVIFTIAYAGRWLSQNTYAELVLWILLAAMLLILIRIFIANYLRRLTERGITSEAIAIIGYGPLADSLVPLLRGNAQLFGLFNYRSRQTGRELLKIDQSVDDLMKQAVVSKPDRILIAMPGLAERKLLSLVERLRPLDIPVDLCPKQSGLALQTPCISHIGGTFPVRILIDRPIKNWNAVLKSAEDVILSFIIMIILAPLLFCIAFAIKLDSPGPILFTQRRHGHRSTEFDIYKFRTMYYNADSPQTVMKQTLRGDQRVTRVGRFLRKSSLDELPQIFNVLKGSMSLVGPRPHALDMRTEGQLGHEVIDVYLHRHRVKPGITGWSQANGCRGATQTTAQLRRRIELDLYYVENWSLLFDLKIMCITFREVLRATNAY